MEEGGKRKEGGGSIGTFDKCTSVSSVREVPSFAGFPQILISNSFLSQSFKCKTDHSD